MKTSRRPLSPISALHVFKLCFRSALLVAATVLYIINRLRGSERPFGTVTENAWILSAVGLVFIIEMIFRLFPSRLESMGCQKQFRRNFIPTYVSRPTRSTWRSTAAVAVAWLALNGAIAALFFLGIIDEGIAVLISLFYAVCDMICILFFCPFQTWFMKNKCCGSCRIYNWDYAMMFTPLILVQHTVTYTVLGVALLLLVVWEIQAHRYPERFTEECNAGLGCAVCPEKLCQHKAQLRHFLRTHKEQLRLKGNALLERAKAKLPVRTDKKITPDSTAPEKATDTTASASADSAEGVAQDVAGGIFFERETM